MRGVKPFKLSFVTRPFSWRGKHHLGVGVIGYFPLAAEPTLLTEMELWTETAEVLGPVAIDQGIPKSRSELLVVGSVHQPDGQPGPIRRVTVQVGDMVKSLDVIGDRRWERDVPTAPAPFVSMPLSWDRAFGGAGFDQNPVGKGMVPVDEEGRASVPLPNIETPGRLVRSPRDRPEPAGLGPIDFTWPQRFGLAGTYDKAWLDTRFPGFADDMDWRIWNLAPEDQRRDAPWVGDETVVCDNMHPTRPRLEGRLPGVRARCFVMQRTPGGSVFAEVALQLTTVWVLPEVCRGIMVFHGAQPVSEDDADDIEVILVAAERLGAEPRSIEHYQAALARRTGPDRGLEILNEKDLMPDDLAGLGTLEAAMAQMTHEGLRHKRARAALEERVRESRARLSAMGIDPDEHGMKELEPERELPKLDQIGDAIKAITAEAERTRAEQEAVMEQKVRDLEKLCGETGVRYEDILAEMKATPRGPPELTAEKQRAKFQALRDQAEALGQPVDELDHYLDPEGDMMQLFRTSEEQLKTIYRQSAQLQDPAYLAPADVAAARRAAVEEAYRRGESLAGWDLTGVDLAGIDLAGANLHRAFLESTNFAGARLDGANLTEAVLAHANFADASVSGADLGGSNLGRSVWHRARLARSNLRGAILTGVDLSSADLSECVLDDATLDDARLDGALLRGASLASATFRSTSLRGVSFAGARLDWAMFATLDLTELDFSGASLGNTAFYQCRLDGASFVNARGPNLRVVVDCSFAKADLRGAFFPEACFRSASMPEANLSGANFDRADFSNADLTGANLYRAVARSALFIRASLRNAQLVSANLFESLLEKADLRGADMRGANLYGASFSLIRSDAATRADDAIQDRVRILPRREEP